MSQKKAFALRIDRGVWDEIQRWSDDELRSVNSQIEVILRDAIQSRKGKKSSGVREAGRNSA